MLEKVIVIFRYLQDKDVFENFYKTHLSKRLLGGRSVSDEVRSLPVVPFVTGRTGLALVFFWGCAGAGAGAGAGVGVVVGVGCRWH